MLLHIQDLRRAFKSEEQCLEFLFERQFAQVTCRHCGRKNAFHRHPTKPCYTCNCGRTHIFPRKGTLFERSAVPLLKWMYGIFLVSTSPGGVSVKDLQRKLDVSYVTAWKMTKKLRDAKPSEQNMRSMRNIESLIASFAHLPAPETKTKDGSRASSIPVRFAALSSVKR